jgi:site-specific DNA-methyltransferase (adenine-specific)
MVLNKIYNEDCLLTIDRFENLSIDLVITSPPYNVNLGDNKYNKTPYDLYNDNLEHKEYLSWLENIFKNLYPKIKSGGRVCINIGDGKNGNIPTHSDIIQFMTSELNYIPITTIIWQKNNVSNRTSWGSFLSPSCPSFPTPFEYVLVFCKENRKLQYSGEIDIERQEFIDWSLSYWEIAPEKGKKVGHPAPFPIELPKRLMKLFSYKNSLVYDPFMGSGTTALACIKNNRNFVGSEISQQYCELIDKRILELKQQMEIENSQRRLF